MGSVTPVVVPGEGYVRVEVNWTDFPHARKCWIYRRVGTGPLTMLRDGNAARLSGGIAVAFDHEMPLDVPVRYRSVIALNYNGDFEDGVSEWTDSTNNGTVGTVTQSFDYYVVGEGQASAKLTPSGAATSKAVSEFIPAVAGQVYTISGRLMVPDYWAGGIGVQIQWYNGTTPNGTSGSLSDLAPFPGVFGSYGFSATAPVGTTQAKIVGGIAGSPAATLPLYLDEMYLTTTGTGVDAPTAVIVPSDGGGWWTDPLHPWTKVRLQVELDNPGLCAGRALISYLGVAELTRPADSTALEINDSEYPIATWNQRKSGRQSIRIGTQTLADLAALRLLHASGAPLLLQLNAAYGREDVYGLHGDLIHGYVHGDQRVSWRLNVAAFAEVLAPVGPAEGTLRARYEDYTKFSTFADFAASGGGGYDTYARTVANGFGTSTSGLVTTTSGGAASEYSVGSGVGTIAVAALSALRVVLYPGSILDFDERVRLIGGIPTGGNVEQHVYARYLNSTNYVRLRIFRVAAGGMTMQISQVVAGVETSTGFITVPSAANNSTVQVHFTGTGTALAGTVWVDGGVEPQTPTVTLTTSWTTAGQSGIGAILGGTVSNPLPLSLSVDDFSITNLAGGATWLDGLQGELVA